MARFNGSKSAYLAAVALAVGTAVTLSPASAQETPAAALPEYIELTGIVRDFQERSMPAGHPDFERKPSEGFGHYVSMVADELDESGKPVFHSTGYKVTSQWKDASGRNIMPPTSYLPMPQGGTAGAVQSSSGGACTTAEALSQWFRDVPGVNASRPLTLRLERQNDSNVYTFDDKVSPLYSNLGGFFPINGQLYGNSSGETKNFHFTFELETKFRYQANTGQVFTFKGDDDVWVFIDGKKVIDIGGVHSSVTQTIELDRLDWLQDGKSYQLKFFFAERHRTQSNFRIETTLLLQNVDLPTTTALYD